MTERLTALAVLVNSGFEAEKGKALAMFADYFKDDPLVMDQWFSVQAGSPLPGAPGADAAPGLHPEEPEQGARADRRVRQPEPGQLPSS